MVSTDSVSSITIADKSTPVDRTWSMNWVANESGLFDDWDERRRADHSAVGILSANESLDTANLAGCHVHDRLVVKDELVVLDSSDKQVLEFDLFDGQRTHV